MTKKKKVSNQQQELMRALNITPDDLDANDNGIITDRQRQTLPKREAYQWHPAAVIGAVFAGMSIIMPLIAFTVGDTDDTVIILIISAIFFAVAALMGILGVYQHMRLKSDLDRNIVETTQGIAVVSVQEKRAQLEINGLKLKASLDVLRRIRHLDPYIVHYLPNSDVILSMDHISDDDNIRRDVASDRLTDSDDDAIYDDGLIDAEQSQRDSR